MAQIYLKNWLLIILIATSMGILSSCTGPLMNQQNYNQIQVGMAIEEVQSIAGQPYRVNHPNPSTQTYEYIERFDVGAGKTHQNTYVLTIQNGKVIDKQITNECPNTIGIEWR